METNRLQQDILRLEAKKIQGPNKPTSNPAQFSVKFRVGRLATLHGEIAIAACGVGKLRVRRWQTALAATQNSPFFAPFFVMDFSHILHIHTLSPQKEIRYFFTCNSSLFNSFSYLYTRKHKKHGIWIIFQGVPSMSVRMTTRTISKVRSNKQSILLNHSSLGSPARKGYTMRTPGATPLDLGNCLSPLCLEGSTLNIIVLPSRQRGKCRLSILGRCPKLLKVLAYSQIRTPDTSVKSIYL